MQFIRPFQELNKNDSALAGGKGASLGEMTQVGIPVPPGFVILAPTFDHFIEEASLKAEIQAALDEVNHKEIHTVESAAEKIKALILAAEMPVDIATDILQYFHDLNAKFVAVRSSATAEDGAEHAWAGQLDSYLNTTEDQLLDKVKHCWASLFTPRAIFYRFEKGLHDSTISVAVVVQNMVESETSGIAFSVHPVTEDQNQLIIEAGFGLGEAIVSGQITPDSYVVQKDPREIIEVQVNQQTKGLYRDPSGGNIWKVMAEEGKGQVLSSEQILELSTLILKIESHYGFPCDIEWAYEKGRFYIVQSRPITTLSSIVTVPRQKFVKAYTRNFSIIMQQLWFVANKDNLIEQLELVDYPYDPPYLYFMKDGVEEVWENTAANGWLLDRLRDKVLSETEFFSKVHDRYFETLNIINPFWKKKISNLEQLEEFALLVQQGINDFVILYGVLALENVSPEIKNQAEVFRENDVFFSECNSTIMRALDSIYPSNGHLNVYILREELRKDISKDILEKRDQGFALIPRVVSEPMTFDQMVTAFPQLQFVIEQGEHDAIGIKGQTAYRGKVKGKVRIVKRKDQADSVEVGEVIVSPMTTPDFVPAMKHAAGFVTDEGGVTCHAAIIARELKKPCIIGTKIASQVLKDGDLVEVDADNGIVKIIKKA